MLELEATSFTNLLFLEGGFLAVLPKVVGSWIAPELSIPLFSKVTCVEGSMGS